MRIKLRGLVAHLLLHRGVIRIQPSWEIWIPLSTPIHMLLDPTVLHHVLLLHMLLVHTLLLVSLSHIFLGHTLLSMSPIHIFLVHNKTNQSKDHHWLSSTEDLLLMLCRDKHLSTHTLCLLRTRGGHTRTMQARTVATATGWGTWITSRIWQ